MRYINLHTSDLKCGQFVLQDSLDGIPQEELVLRWTRRSSASLHDDDDTHSAKACSYADVMYQLGFKGHFSWEDPLFEALYLLTSTGQTLVQLIQLGKKTLFKGKNKPEEEQHRRDPLNQL